MQFVVSFVAEFLGFSIGRPQHLLADVLKSLLLIKLILPEHKHKMKYYFRTVILATFQSTHRVCRVQVKILPAVLEYVHYVYTVILKFFTYIGPRMCIGYNKKKKGNLGVLINRSVYKRCISHSGVLLYHQLLLYMCIKYIIFLSQTFCIFSQLIQCSL